MIVYKTFYCRRTLPARYDPCFPSNVDHEKGLAGTSISVVRCTMRFPSEHFISTLRKLLKSRRARGWVAVGSSMDLFGVSDLPRCRSYPGRPEAAAHGMPGDRYEVRDRRPGRMRRSRSWKAGCSWDGSSSEAIHRSAISLHRTTTPGIAVAQPISLVWQL